jgi:hypothetical protein
LNGSWILFEYDNKQEVTHNFSDGIVVAEGANDLKVVINDNVETDSLRLILKPKQ